MNQGRTVFSQILDPLHPQQFERCVVRYRGDTRVRSLSCWEQFLAMGFAQLTFREGLRDIVDCLNTRPDQLYHLGFRNPVRRSTLADANEIRDWRIYADLAQILIGKARRLYCDEELDVDLKETVYALDSTTIDLCLSLFPWARFRRTKGAIKLHTLLDLRGPIPSPMSEPFCYTTRAFGRCFRISALNFLMREEEKRDKEIGPLSSCNCLRFHARRNDLLRFRPESVRRLGNVR